MSQRICDHKQNKINLLPSPSYLLLCDLKCLISYDWIVTENELIQFFKDSPFDKTERTDVRPPSANSEVMTVKEAAAMMRISLPKMYEFARSGKVRTLEFGRRILISRSSLLALLSGIVVILLSIFFPSVIFRICGVSSSKYPNLIPYMRDYMHGLMIGIPATMLVHVMGPLFVMDNGKRLFTVSSLCLCAVDITGDLLNVFVFRGGAFGMGLTTSISHLVQLLILFRHFLRPEHYFRLSPKLMRSFHPYQVFRNGTPSLIKEICTTLRDILTNNINVLTALSAAAIAARGIQPDIYTFLLCIPLGLGKSMVSMTGIFHSANDSSSWTSVRFQGSSGIDRFQPHSSVAFRIYNKLHTLQGDSETI